MKSLYHQTTGSHHDNPVGEPSCEQTTRQAIYRTISFETDPSGKLLADQAR